jgi:hypothetical protein
MNSSKNSSRWFWITLPINHFTENFWPKGHLTETSFDRTPFGRMPFDRKFIRPDRRLTERRLTECSFYRKKSFGREKKLSQGRFTDFFWKVVIWPKLEKLVKWPKWHITESSFDRKLIPNNGHLIESSNDRKLFNHQKWLLDQKVIWPKVIWLSVKWPFFEKLSVKWTFGQMTFWSNDHFQKKFSVKWTFGQMNSRLNEFSVKWDFLLKVDSVKWPFSEKKNRSYDLPLKQTFGQMSFG